MESILTSVKKMLGIAEEYTHFDLDIIMNINSVLFTLTQIGVGPSGGVQISSDKDTWDDILEGRLDLEAVKTYMFLKVRLLFDPPSNSFLVDAMERQASEFEWRLHIQSQQKGGASI